MGEAIIRLTSGKLVDVFHLKPDDVTIQDIAHALSLLNRFGGHTPYGYSVAQHSVFVGQLCLALAKDNPSRIAYWGLMHDASEGVGCVDLPSPVKKHCPDYRRAELTVANQLGMQFDYWPNVLVEECDSLACEVEQTYLRGVPPTERALQWLPEAAIHLRRMEPREAEALFLFWYAEWRPQ